MGRLFEGSFRQAYRKDIKRPDVLAFFRSMQAEGRLETRDRVRNIGEQVCDWADVEGDGYNPFRACKKQLTVNVSTPRPDVTEAEDVVRVFRLINQRRENVPFGDVVGDALRLDALTIPRPGMIHSMEWREVDLDIEQRWTIPAVKMKTGWDHVVPLSRQATAILERVQKITGNRRYVFSCADDEPLSHSMPVCAHSVSIPRANIALTVFAPRSRPFAITRSIRKPKHGMAMLSNCNWRISKVRR
jgi:integrase